MTNHRFLVQFNPKHTPHPVHGHPHHQAPGIAGRARRPGSAAPVGCVGRHQGPPAREQHAGYAQGGIAGVLSPEDRFENHIEDTLTAGAGLCHRDVVELVVREAPQQIHDLIQWGTHFDEEDGHLALTREGGHSHRRIVHALGDATGHEVMRAIIARSRATPHLTLWDDSFTLDLLTHAGACVGALLWRPGQGKLLVWAKQTILASGGAGMVYRETTNPPVATGDGIAAAYRAGARLRDLEFMQFHPTVLYVAGSSRFLISEAVRGEGAYLRDKNGRRFMVEVDPRAELAPRDVVAQAIVRCMEQTRHPNVYLDLSHLDRALVQRRFPGIDRVCRGFGLDITHDLIPIRPGAHYMIGGAHRGPGKARPHHAAGPVGRRRSHQQRLARGQSVGIQQSAGGPGVWRCLWPRRRDSRRGAAGQFHGPAAALPVRPDPGSVGRGRHHQFATQSNGAAHGRGAGTPGTGTGGPGCGVLVPLCAGRGSSTTGPVGNCKICILIARLMIEAKR